MRVETVGVHAIDDALTLLSLQFHGHGIELSAEVLRAALQGLLADQERGAVLLAYDPEPIGIAVLAYTWTLEHGGRVAWLDELFVVEHRRDEGVGGAMLERALQVAIDAGCRAIDLEVDPDHGRSEHLYERQGFRPLPRRRWVKSFSATSFR
jgi:GNAT superfamily N-acetyltransferase